jgi:DNA-binding CsgD family transcriptional regulator
VLTDLMTRLLCENATSGVILLRSDNDESQPDIATPVIRQQIVSFAVTGFISLSLAQTLLGEQFDTPLVEWLYAREIAGEAVFLRPDDQAACNRGEGMALVFLHFYAPPGDPGDPLVQKSVEEMQHCFRLHHGGYHCRLALHPLAKDDDGRGKNSLLAMGFEAVGDGKHMMQLHLDKLAETPFHPFVSLQRTGEPVLGLSPGEKRLLTLALWGYGDPSIADALSISIETVRKRWRNVFQKIEDHPELPFFSPNRASAEATRGPQKRSTVLRYLDSHLCEIRP